MKRILLTAILGLALLAPAIAATPEEDAIERRHAIFELIAFNVGTMGGMVREKTPFDQAEFKKRALNAAFMAQMLDEHWPAGSDKGGTDALPAIWENEADFRAKLKSFQDQANSLYKASKTGTLDTLKPEFGKLIEQCKGCHDKYKAD